MGKEQHKLSFFALSAIFIFQFFIEFQQWFMGYILVFRFVLVYRCPNNAGSKCPIFLAMLPF
jgi:hypothetical protein